MAGVLDIGVERRTASTNSHASARGDGVEDSWMGDHPDEAAQTTSGTVNGSPGDAKSRHHSCARTWCICPPV